MQRMRPSPKHRCEGTGDAVGVNRGRANPALAAAGDQGALALQLGSITPGKWADFVVLDRDIMAVAPEQLRTTGVLATYLEGEVVYCSDPFCARAPATTAEATARIAERLETLARWRQRTAGPAATEVRPEPHAKCGRSSARERKRK